MKKVKSFFYLIFFVNLPSIIEQFMANNEKTGTLNRIRVVLAEQEKTNRWLAEKLGKTEHTISRWCHNKSQPSVAQLNEIANVLNVDVRTLMNSNL